MSPLSIISLSVNILLFSNGCELEYLVCRAFEEIRRYFVEHALPRGEGLMVKTLGDRKLSVWVLMFFKRCGFEL